MENQENISGKNKDTSRSSLSSPPGGTPDTGSEPEKKEFGGGQKGGEIDTGKLHDNQEIDLDRTGPNEPNPSEPKKTQESDHVHPGEGTSRGYEGNTPDIDEQTLKYGGAGESLKKQLGSQGDEARP